MIPKVVIVINGRPRSGKDTVSQMVCRRMIAEGWRAHSVSSIDPVRNWLRTQGVPVDQKGPPERRLMAEVKEALERYDWQATRMCAVDVMLWLEEVPDRPAICFAHMRELDAIAMFKDFIPDDVAVRTLLVEREGLSEEASNAADRNAGKMLTDYLIRNNGTVEDLRRVCGVFAHDLMEEFDR